MEKNSDISTENLHRGTQKLSDVIEIGFLEIEKAEFYKNEGGFTGLRYNGDDYSRISLRRALPLGNPDKYISIADKENKEIAIIEDVSKLCDEQKKIVEDELFKRYYTPIIKAVKSVKEKLGYVYFELVLASKNSEYNKNCAVKDVSKNVRLIKKNQLIIFDVDGNRYLADNLSGLDSKSLRRLEPFMF